MTGVVLVWAGVFAVVSGAWRGYGAARAALLPWCARATRRGRSSRRHVRSHARVRVRLAARHVCHRRRVAEVAMYGMYLVTVGVEVGS